MDFGFSRFLEMFEDRFGRLATTVLIGVLALAATSWAIKTVIEFAIYIYELSIKSRFLSAIETESIFWHSLFFAVQFLITVVILGYLWRKFAELRIRNLRNYFESEMEKMMEKLAASKKMREDVMTAVALHKDAVERTMAAMEIIKRATEAEVEKLHALQKQQPHPTPTPQDKPETK
jgi:hypothetical protein